VTDASRDGIGDGLLGECRLVRVLGASGESGLAPPPPPGYAIQSTLLTRTALTAIVVTVHQIICRGLSPPLVRETKPMCQTIIAIPMTAAAHQIFGDLFTGCHERVCSCRNWQE